jgi:hypothetical protein
MWRKLVTHHTSNMINFEPYLGTEIWADINEFHRVGDSWNNQQPWPTLIID